MGSGQKHASKPCIQHFPAKPHHSINLELTIFLHEIKLSYMLL